MNEEMNEVMNDNMNEEMNDKINEEINEEMNDKLNKGLKDKLNDKLNEMSLEERVIEMLKQRQYTFSSAESCTGGMLMSTLINVSGASSVINEGFITYANEAKMKYLFVNEETLRLHGAVSHETAQEMAQGVQKQTGADVGVGITGIAGPLGGTNEKPVGTVFVGCQVKDKTYVKHLKLHGDRLTIRTSAVSESLKFVVECLLKSEKNDL